ARVWEAVKSEHGNCRGRRCSGFKDCFYWRARRRLDNAHIIVANHALLFSDLVLKDQDVPLLPEYKFVIIDEAHNIENVAQEHFGIEITNHRVKFLLDGLYNPAGRRGAKGALGLPRRSSGRRTGSTHRSGFRESGAAGCTSTL
ncbi:MAG: hypothetical protein C4523_10445, partial [Myxococcales bacterium]